MIVSSLVGMAQSLDFKRIKISCLKIFENLVIIESDLLTQHWIVVEDNLLLLSNCFGINFLQESLFNLTK